MRQPELNFDSSPNMLKRHLEEGVFSILFELEAPEKDCEMDNAIARVRPFAEAVSSITAIPCGILVTDNRKGAEPCDTIDFAAGALPPPLGRHAVVLSGRGRGAAAVGGALAKCHAAGLRNVLCVTGDGLAGMNRRGALATTWTDSLQSLAAATAAGLFPGCAMNPFNYTPPSVFPPYYKLAKKVAAGAAFAVVQAGWDMAKLQEVRWFLESREMPLPLMARAMILDPESLDLLEAGRPPGVRPTPEFLRQLRSEFRYSEEQFMAAQWRRLQIMAAGARLMGYSAVVVAGAASPRLAQTAAARTAAALAEFLHFDGWKGAYLDHAARSEMAFHPHDFHLYENIFEGNDAGAARAAAVKTPRPGFWERLSFALRAPEPGTPLPPLLPPGAAETLGRLASLCLSLCPKRLVGGPCGGGRHNGECEFGAAECAHAKAFRLAHALGKAHLIEDMPPLPPPSRMALDHKKAP